MPSCSGRRPGQTRQSAHPGCQGRWRCRHGRGAGGERHEAAPSSHAGAGSNCAAAGLPPQPPCTHPLKGGGGGGGENSSLQGRRRGRPVGARCNQDAGVGRPRAAASRRAATPAAHGTPSTRNAKARVGSGVLGGSLALSHSAGVAGCGGVHVSATLRPAGRRCACPRCPWEPGGAGSLPQRTPGVISHHAGLGPARGCGLGVAHNERPLERLGPNAVVNALEHKRVGPARGQRGPGGDRVERVRRLIPLREACGHGAEHCHGRTGRVRRPQLNRERAPAGRLARQHQHQTAHKIPWRSRGVREGGRVCRAASASEPRRAGQACRR